MKLVCVTPNPAVDRLLVVPGFRVGSVWRARETRLGGGGKGLNVARALVRLGGSVTCAGVLAGHVGQQIAELAETEDFDASWIWVTGETRTTSIVIDAEGASTVINEPGPAVSEANWARFVDHVAQISADACGASICGSLPPGVPDGGLTSLIARIGDPARCQVWVDTSGAALTEAIGARPWGVKVNAAEAAAALGQPISSFHGALGAARAIRDRGITVAAVTLGADGAVAVRGEGAWVAQPPAVTTLNAIGSGDCFLAGLMAACARGEGMADALRLATACGAANAMQRQVGDFVPTDLTALMTQTFVDSIAG